MRQNETGQEVLQFRFLKQDPTFVSLRLASSEMVWRSGKNTVNGCSKMKK